MGKRVNKKYKDKLFRMVFREKDKLLSLYNAVNQSNYENPEDLEIVTLENAIYMNMKNDIAFVIQSSLNLYEHQSTYNPNMPLRNLLYVSREYEKMIAGESVYSSRLIRLPFPKFIVFYNGTAKQPEYKELKLSDAYYLPKGYDGEVIQPELELKVIMLNINLGNNKELLEACQTLKEYVIYVEKVRNYAKTMPLEKAVDCAIKECINQGVLADFLIKYRAEAKSVSIFEYDEEKEMELFRKAEREYIWETERKKILDLERENMREELKEEIEKEARGEYLKSMVLTLKPLLPDFESVYNAITANIAYADITQEEVKKYY